VELETEKSLPEVCQVCEDFDFLRRRPPAAKVVKKLVAIVLLLPPHEAGVTPRSSSNVALYYLPRWPLSINHVQV